jgi:hypothetical protein
MRCLDLKSDTEGLNMFNVMCARQYLNLSFIELTTFITINIKLKNVLKTRLKIVYMQLFLCDERLHSWSHYKPFIDV